MLIVQTVCTCHSIVGEKHTYILHNVPRPVSFAADQCFLEIILFFEQESKCTADLKSVLNSFSSDIVYFIQKAQMLHNLRIFLYILPILSRHYQTHLHCSRGGKN